MYSFHKPFTKCIAKGKLHKYFLSDFLGTIFENSVFLRMFAL